MENGLPFSFVEAPSLKRLVSFFTKRKRPSDLVDCINRTNIGTYIRAHYDSVVEKVSIIIQLSML